MPRTLLTLLALVAAVPVARANQNFVDVSTSVSPEAGATVRLEADGTIGAHRIRTAPGLVRVWFRGMEDIYLERPGDGRVIRRVRLRPGAVGTAVALIRLGDGRRVRARDVSVEREGTTVQVRIAPDALLGLFAEPPPAEPVLDLTPVALDEEGARGQAGEAGDRGESPGAASAEAASAEGPAPDAPSPAALALSRPMGAATLASGSGAPVTLFFLTLFLAGAFLAITLYQRRKKGAPQPPIEVIAARRIGTRHQLLVVRALGEDHLLSVQSGKTEKLASTPAPPLEGGESAAGDSPLLPLLEKKSGAPRGPDERPRFGADLLRLAGQRNHEDRVSVGGGSRNTPPPSPSEAVAGLLRLRERLGR